MDVNATFIAVQTLPHPSGKRAREDSCVGGCVRPRAISALWRKYVALWRPGKKLRTLGCAPYIQVNITILLLKFHFKVRRTANIKQQMAVALIVFCLMQNEGKDCQALNKPRTKQTSNTELKKWIFKCRGRRWEEKIWKRSQRAIYIYIYKEWIWKIRLSYWRNYLNSCLPSKKYNFCLFVLVRNSKKVLKNVLNVGRSSPLRTLNSSLLERTALFPRHIRACGLLRPPPPPFHTDDLNACKIIPLPSRQVQVQVA